MAASRANAGEKKEKFKPERNCQISFELRQLPLQ